MPSSTSGRKSLLQRLDDRNQRWAERLHPEVTVHSSVYGLLSIRLLLPQRHEGQQVGQLPSLFGRAKWDRTTAPGEELRAHILGSFFALRSPQSVPGHNHRIFVVVVSSLGGDQIGLLSRERWFNLSEGQTRIEQLRLHFSSGGEFATTPAR